MSALSSQYLFNTLTQKVNNNDTKCRGKVVVLYKKEQHSINGTIVTVYIAFDIRNSTVLRLDFENEYAFCAVDCSGPADYTQPFADIDPVLHLSKEFEIFNFPIELDTIDTYKSAIIEKLDELLGLYHYINSNYTVVGTELITKHKYNQLLNLHSDSLQTCCICTDDTLPSEQLSCGHHIHSACLSNYCKNTDFEAADREPGDNEERRSFKCAVCRKHTFAPVWKQ
jgi:hypothetical protein